MEEWITGRHISFKIEDRSYLAILKREVHRLAIQCGLNEKKIAEIRTLLSDITTALPPAAAADKAKLDAQIKSISELAAKSAESKAQFDIIKKNIDQNLIKLPGVKFRF